MAVLSVYRLSTWAGGHVSKQRGEVRQEEEEEGEEGWRKNDDLVRLELLWGH